MLAVTGFRRPNSAIVRSLAARAAMFANEAAAAADSQEKLDLSDSSKAWKLWVIRAGEASASAAHKFSRGL